MVEGEGLPLWVRAILYMVCTGLALTYHSLVLAVVKAVVDFYIIVFKTIFARMKGKW